MLTVIRKWGNSASVRIPSSIMRGANLNVNRSIYIREEHGKIIIEPADDVYDLRSLLDGITPENLHSEADFGKPVGREIM